MGGPMKSWKPYKSMWRNDGKYRRYPDFQAILLDKIQRDSYVYWDIKIVMNI